MWHTIQRLSVHGPLAHRQNQNGDENTLCFHVYFSAKPKWTFCAAKELIKYANRCCCLDLRSLFSYEQNSFVIVNLFVLDTSFHLCDVDCLNMVDKCCRILRFEKENGNWQCPNVWTDFDRSANITNYNFVCSTLVVRSEPRFVHVCMCNCVSTETLPLNVLQLSYIRVRLFVVNVVSYDVRYACVVVFLFVFFRNLAALMWFSLCDFKSHSQCRVAKWQNLCCDKWQLWFCTLFTYVKMIVFYIRGSFIQWKCQN